MPERTPVSQEEMEQNPDVKRLLEALKSAEAFHGEIYEEYGDDLLAVTVVSLPNAKKHAMLQGVATAVNYPMAITMLEQAIGEMKSELSDDVTNNLSDLLEALKGAAENLQEDDDDS